MHFCQAIALSFRSWCIWETRPAHQGLPDKISSAISSRPTVGDRECCKSYARHNLR
ncbi:MAG: hypothetical protein ICV78_22050 [Tolypothrix sp. Co-bin9]|nr:hypothetical protein [Tolypothrix sp. Co-bin9]